MRTFLIHTLGPAGVEPSSILDRVEKEQDAGILRALILSLGEIPGWSAADHRRRRSRLYGTHRMRGSMARRSGCSLGGEAAVSRLRTLPGVGRAGSRLSRRNPAPDTSWRVNASGLTLISIGLPGPVRDRRHGGFPESSRLSARSSPGPQNGARGRVPGQQGRRRPRRLRSANGWATGRESRRRSCHVAAKKVDSNLVPGWEGKRGYRLMTAKEFQLATRARDNGIEPLFRTVAPIPLPVCPLLDAGG